MLNGGGAPGGAGTLTMGGACQNCLPSGAGSLGLGGDAPGGNERGGGGGGGLYGGGAGQGGALLGGAGGGGGGGGSSGFAASARNTSVGADATGVPSVTIVYVSDAFKLSRPAVSRGGTITLPITVAGAGRITAVGTARVPARLRGRSRPKTGGRITYGAATVSPVSSGTVRLPIKPKGVVKRLLRDGATLTVTIRVTFAPNGGSKNTQTIHVSVNGGKKRRHS